MLTKDECLHVVERVRQLLPKSGASQIYVNSVRQGASRWARNRVSMASDRWKHSVHIYLKIGTGYGSASTNQLDDASLEFTVRSAEHQTQFGGKRTFPLDMLLEQQAFGPAEQTEIWSDATFRRTPESRGTAIQRLTERSERGGMVSAGYLESHGEAVATCDIDAYGRTTYFSSQATVAQCSMTVRHPKGTGSGWAGLSSYDITQIDEAAIADRAYEKCVASIDAVRIEPGRYTTILEPQAVADMMEHVVKNLNFRGGAESGIGPFALDYDPNARLGRSKLGLPVVDRRITIDHDPSDPLLGIMARPGMRAVTWIDRGVLTNLSYDQDYALKDLVEPDAVQSRLSFRVSGGSTSLESMIASTSRGLLVTRFSDLTLLDSRTVLLTGTTRDGLWLIENGRITKAVRNFRITESPMFVLNNIEEIGVSTPVFNPGGPYNFRLNPIVVPPLKVRDFSFTSMVEAI